MKKLVYFLFPVFMFSYYYSLGNFKIVKQSVSDPREKFVELSKKKWRWIMDRQMDSLKILFDDQIISMEPEIRMDKPGLLDVIKNGNIRYERINILETNIQIVDNTSTLLSKVEFKFLGRKEDAEIKYVKEIYKRSGNYWTLTFLQINPV